MNDDFESRTRARLQDSAEHLDARVCSRLTQARHLALAEYEQRASRPFRTPGFWLPGSVVAGAAVLALTVFLVRPDATPPAAAVAAVEDVTSVEDIELLAAADGLDLLAEEAAFYEWAGETDALAPAASG
ncbi:MAG: DUF3619 family protein [Steroidobacteraceae bacterium]|jgi:hypothetical protein|nr:DUF3619 family protein [Steroidobacteraceae bacterium]